MKTLMALIVCMLTGCSTYDLLIGSTIYCSDLSDDVRKAALERMQGTWSGYPEHSICDAEGFIVDIIRPDD